MASKKELGKGVERLKEVLTKKLLLPSDVVSGDMLITLTENKEALIENYKGLITYEPTCIVVKGKHTTLTITGTRLNIKYFTNDDMKIEGCIQCIEYIH